MYRSNRTLRTAMLATVAVLAAAALAGCSGGQPAAPAETGAASAVPAVAPTVKLVEPLDGATVPAGDLKVDVETTGLTFVMPSNTNVAGEGHVHYTLDDRPFLMSVTTDAVFEAVEPGEHKLVAELVQNNTQSFDPPVKQEITFTAE